MLNKEQLWNLRKQIYLGSLYYADYENDMDIDCHKVCDFFDCFLDYITERIEEEYGKYIDAKDQEQKWNSHWTEFDNPDELENWYWWYDCDPLPIEGNDDE